MREQPDLTLPERVPEMERYHDSPMQLLPFALYALCNLDKDRMEAYRQLCASGLENDTVRLPSRWSFHGESLRAIVNSHVELGQRGEFDPTYFIVCAYAECSTVVLVTLDDDDMDCKPDLLWAPMDQAGLLCNSFQLGNSDWGEAKEEDLGGPQWFQPGPGDPSATERRVTAPVPTVVPLQTDYGVPPPVGFQVQLYATDGVDEGELLHDIQPGPESQRNDTSQHSCKLQHLSVAEGHDPAREAANVHPSRCLEHPTLQKNYFLIADMPDFLEDGVQIVQVDWDGVVDGKTHDELLEIGRNANLEIQRAEVPETADRAAVGLVLMIAQGYQKWAVKHKLFAAYASDYPDSGIHISEAVDPRWVDRRHGQDRVVSDGSIGASQGATTTQFLHSLWQKHARCCRAQRFVPDFVPGYLIWCGEEPVTADSQVTMMKLDWAGSMPGDEGDVDNAAARTSVWKTPAKDAHRILSDVVGGKKAWNGSSLETG